MKHAHGTKDGVTAQDAPTELRIFGFMQCYKQNAPTELNFKSVNDTVNDTVFNLIKRNNMITSTEISLQLKISLSTAKRKIKELKESGKIERIGSDKTGHWKIAEN